MNKKEFIVIASVIALVIIVALFGIQKKAEAPAREGNATVNTIVANDQPLGDSAIIAEVALAQDGYVVLHKSRNGLPMDIIGISEVLVSGIYSDVAVEYSADVSPDEEVIALIHEDNGDGIFSPADDISALDDEGALVKSAFVVTE